LLKEHANEFAQGIMDTQNQIKTQLKEHLNHQITEFTQSEVEKHKQATHDELSVFYQTHLVEAQQDYSHQIASLSQRLTQDITDHAQTLLGQTNQQLSETQSTLTQQVIERIQLSHAELEQATKDRMQQTETTLVQQATLQAKVQLEDMLKQVVDQVRSEFKNSINADIPDVEKMFSDIVNQRLHQALLTFESHLMGQVKSEILEALSTIKFTFGGK
jgi:hypothetical protein